MIELYNEDCILGMQHKIASNSIDLIVTSPPYNIGTKYKNYNDSVAREEYLTFMVDIMAQFHRILSPDGSIFLNISGTPSDPTVPFDVMNIFLRAFKVQNVFHWIKNISIPTINQSFGHFKPINSKRYVNDCHEYVFHFTRNGDVELNRLALGVEYADKTNTKRWKSSSQGIRCRGNNWFIPYQTIQSRDKERPHPASFPVELPKHCMMIHGVEKINIALDPFLGIGTSALAAKNLGVNFIGFEIDKTYFEEAVNRTIVNDHADLVQICI